LYLAPLAGRTDGQKAAVLSAAKHYNFAMKLAIGSYSKALLPSTVVNNRQRSDFVGQNFWYFTFNTNVSIAAACSMSLAILTTLTLSLVTPHPRRCCCCLQLVTMHLCEHP